jgi:hypothetical protein
MNSNPDSYNLLSKSIKIVHMLYGPTQVNESVKVLIK